MENNSIVDLSLSIVIPTTGNENMNLLLKSIHADSTLKKHEVIVVGSLSLIHI